jgi:hypothetical protein
LQALLRQVLLLPLCLAYFDEQKFGVLRVRPVPQGLHRHWDSFAERSC